MEDAKISTESLVTERLRVTLAETEAETSYERSIGNYSVSRTSRIISER
jgi:hypothetical protein